MKYLSVCSGIEAATVAWHPLGWRPVAFSEIVPFPSAVLAHHYPDIRNLGDMTKFQDWPDYETDVLVGGTPCQSFSVAGLRAGLDDPRGNLMLVYLAIAAKYRPAWLVWENVPGVLSSNGGRDFGTFLGGLAELGYGFAYRVLDAQYCGVPQRRRRVFVIGCAGDWRRAAAVLFERESLRRNPAPGRGQGQAAPTIPARSTGGTGRGTPLTLAIRGRGDSCQLETRDDGIANSVLTPSGGRAGIGVGAIAHVNVLPTMQNGADTPSGHSARSGDTKDNYIVPLGMSVRRLTPRECERLQGFPDDYTLVPYRGRSGEKCPDGPRYKALGNSMAVPVMRWIGARIHLLDSLMKVRSAA